MKTERDKGLFGKDKFLVEMRSNEDCLKKILDDISRTKSNDDVLISELLRRCRRCTSRLDDILISYQHVINKKIYMREDEDK